MKQNIKVPNCLLPRTETESEIYADVIGDRLWHETCLRGNHNDDDDDMCHLLPFLQFQSIRYKATNLMGERKKTCVRIKHAPNGILSSSV